MTVFTVFTVFWSAFWGRAAAGEVDRGQRIGARLFFSAWDWGQGLFRLFFFKEVQVLTVFTVFTVFWSAFWGRAAAKEGRHRVAPEPSPGWGRRL